MNRDGTIDLENMPESMVEKLQRQGLITPEEARAAKQQNKAGVMMEPDTMKNLKKDRELWS